MNKKTYQKPSMKVFDIKPAQILCGSPDDPYNWQHPGAYIPGAPSDSECNSKA